MTVFVFIYLFSLFAFIIIRQYGPYPSFYQLSENGGSRQIRVSAMESFYSLIHFVIGSICTTDIQQKTQQIRQFEVLSRYIPTLLRYDGMKK